MSCGLHAKILVSCKYGFFLKAQLILLFFFNLYRFYIYKRMEIKAAAEAISKQKQEEDELL